MTAAEHDRRASTLFAVYHALEGPAYVSAVAAIAFGGLYAARPDGWWLAITASLVAGGLWLIRAGLARRAAHHRFASEYLDAAPPPRSSSGRTIPPPPPEAA
ncbi:MAG TPA: hypothetical protein VD838_02975 [Anaeromyxobacteraceae bacterium]|nr:hypothetical protein [Anaeromyxobacteraceae bacterium]